KKDKKCDYNIIAPVEMEFQAALSVDCRRRPENVRQQKPRQHAQSRAGKHDCASSRHCFTSYRTRLGRRQTRHKVRSKQSSVYNTKAADYEPRSPRRLASPK